MTSWWPICLTSHRLPITGLQMNHDVVLCLLEADIDSCLLTTWNKISVVLCLSPLPSKTQVPCCSDVIKSHFRDKLMERTLKGSGNKEQGFILFNDLFVMLSSPCLWTAFYCHCSLIFSTFFFLLNYVVHGCIYLSSMHVFVASL